MSEMRTDPLPFAIEPTLRVHTSFVHCADEIEVAERATRGCSTDHAATLRREVVRATALLEEVMT